MQHVLGNRYEGVLDEVSRTNPYPRFDDSGGYRAVALIIQIEDKDPCICTVVIYIVGARNSEFRAGDVFDRRPAKKRLPAFPNGFGQGKNRPSGCALFTQFELQKSLVERPLKDIRNVR